MVYEAVMKQTARARRLMSQEAYSHVSRQEDAVLLGCVR